MSRAHQHQGRLVVAAIRKAGSDYTEIVDLGPELGKNLADLDSTLAVFVEPERRRHQISRRAIRFYFRPGQWFPILPRQLGFRVEGIHLRHTAVQKEEDYV